MTEINERPEGYNIGWDVIGDTCITTAAVVTSSPHIGYYYIFETIMWDWDGTTRTSIKNQIIHKNKENAIKVHNYIKSNLERMKINE